MGRICGVSRYRGVLRSIARERSFSHYREDEITAGEISASFASLLRRCCCCCCCRSRHIHRSHSNTLSHRRAHIHHTPSQIHKIEWTRQRHQRHRQRRLIGRQRDHPVCSRYSITSTSTPAPALAAAYSRLVVIRVAQDGWLYWGTKVGDLIMWKKRWSVLTLHKFCSFANHINVRSRSLPLSLSLSRW